MKKIIYGTLFLALVGIALSTVSCKKEAICTVSDASVLQMSPTYSIDEIQSVLNDLNSGAKGKCWEKIKAWFKKHTGSRLFNNCQGPPRPCGPCPGMCFRNEKTFGGEPTSIEIATQADRANGLGVVGISLIQNDETNEEAIMFVFNEEEVNDFTYEGFFYVEDDFYSDEILNDTFTKSSIKFEKGKYHVVYDSTTGYYYSLVKTIIK